MDRDSPSGAHAAYVNEHCPYPELGKPDRRALRDVLKTAFSIGQNSHAMWTDFLDTTAFVRRCTDTTECDLPQGIIGGAIVMSYPADQYDYLAYIAIHPAFRHRRRLFFNRSDGPHHGTHLVRYIYDVMRDRLDAGWMQRSLMIEPYGDEALHFYLRALPANEYPVKCYESERIISVAYDGLAL